MHYCWVEIPILSGIVETATYGKCDSTKGFHCNAPMYVSKKKVSITWKGISHWTVKSKFRYTVLVPLTIV